MNSDYALSVYATASQTVPAYRRFLQENCGTIPEVESLEQFCQLPFMSKESYIKAYPLVERCAGGTLHGKHSLAFSSGSSGRYVYWPSHPETEKNFWRNLYKQLDDNYQISEKPSLVINGLYLGGNLSGPLFAYALRTIGLETGLITLMTPGHNEELCIEAIVEFSKYYQQTILYSYPATAKNIIERAAEQCPDIKNYGIKIRMVGDGYSEAFRDHMNRLLGYPYGYMSAVISGYGATDFRSVGNESMLCIAIRRLLYENDKVREVLELDQIPTICQINTGNIFIEAVEEEFVVTQNNAVPLVRYRTGDAGKIYSHAEMLQRLASAGLDPLKKLADYGYDMTRVTQNPFLALIGRREGAVNFRGDKLFITKIKAALEQDPWLAERLTGEFQVRVFEDAELEKRLELAVVPRPGAGELDAGDVADHFLESFRVIQGALYADLAEKNRSAALPLIRFVARDEIATASGFKIKYIK